MASGSIGDITSYLDPGKEEKGQYFVDQATGQYYYQAADGSTLNVVSAASGNDASGGKSPKILLVADSDPNHFMLF